MVRTVIAFFDKRLFMGDPEDSATPTQETKTKHPHVAVLGWCDGAIAVSGQLALLQHLNILGLSSARVSHVFPFDLRGQKLIFALYEFKPSDSVKVSFRKMDGEEVFHLTLSATGQRFESARGTPGTLGTDEVMPGWHVGVAEIEQSVILFEPGQYNAFQVQPDGGEFFLGSFLFFHATADPITPEDVAVIRSNPRGFKFVRAQVTCNHCGDQLKTYAGVEANPKLESEGFVPNTELPPRFVCSCGRTNFSLEYLRTGMHGWLRKPLSMGVSKLTDFIPIYEKSTLEEYCRQFVELLKLNPPEEEIQKFLLSHEIFFERFVPLKLMHKRPVSTKYFVDFAILNERKELQLVEIEKADMQLLRKDGNITAKLQHAVHQVRQWIQEFADRREACLDGMGLKLDEVAKVTGVVIAGRTPTREEHLRLLRAFPWAEMDFYTYDDLLNGVTGIIRHLKEGKDIQAQR
jgi:hypothetical protein